ncbi:hypothetical protein [Pontibacillus marinus]|uniref:Uncharacterized protein n=1 Tax=Pontibacillus marinus BH030004 = DSM 16465 TaxID=1385511 RepID=A0A0A5GIQ4_9BACI|nr:hypothetical protein [Pontibacillus marinus]KGX91904.1 hypothetical protein N783_00920 [Pontibacillus marinus BH030004 = DSM 16465]
MNIKGELESSIPDNMKMTEKEKATIRHRVHSPYSSKWSWKPVFGSVLCMMIIGVLIISNIQSIEKGQNATIPLNIPSPVHDAHQVSTPLTKEQKEHYYEQYKKIIDTAMEKKTGVVIKVPSMEMLNENSDWVSPEIYKERVQKIVEGHIQREREMREGMSEYVEPAVTENGISGKSKYFYFSGIIREIIVTAQFDTQYSEELDRQVFVGIDNISSQIESPEVIDKGDWEQTSSDFSLVDGSRTYSIQIEGVFSYNSATYEKAFTIEFHCDENGKIY